MKILTPVDKYPASGNPIIDELIARIEHLDSSVKINQSVDLFWDEASNGYDCIHIHWPEALLKWKIPDENDLLKLEEILVEQKKHACIVVTIHNLVSHNSDHRNQELYDLIYGKADVFINMSKRSERLIVERYQGIISPEAKHVVVPHGLYERFINTTTKEEARRKLDLKPSQFVILAFGDTRKKDEARIIKNLIDRFPNDDRKIIVPQWNIRGMHNYFPIFKRKIVDKKHFRLQNIFIPDTEVQYYFNSSDIHLIQRLKSLNSGSLILGFAFKKVVVGPDYGSIGEILRETGNPTFDPYDNNSIIEAVKKGEDLVESNKGAENYNYAKMNWDLSIIANKHISLYKDCV